MTITELNQLLTTAYAAGPYTGLALAVIANVAAGALAALLYFALTYLLPSVGITWCVLATFTSIQAAVTIFPRHVALMAFMFGATTFTLMVYELGACAVHVKDTLIRVVNAVGDRLHRIEHITTLIDNKLHELDSNLTMLVMQNDDNNKREDVQRPMDAGLPHKIYVNKVCRAANLDVYARALASRTAAMNVMDQAEILELSMAVYHTLDTERDPIRKNLVELCETIMNVYIRSEGLFHNEDTKTSHVFWRAVRHSINSRELASAKAVVKTFISVYAKKSGAALPEFKTADSDKKPTAETLGRLESSFHQLARLREHLGKTLIGEPNDDYLPPPSAKLSGSTPVNVPDDLPPPGANPSRPVIDPDVMPPPSIKLSGFRIEPANLTADDDLPPHYQQLKPPATETPTACDGC